MTPVADGPASGTLPSWFAHRASMTPHATALTAGGISMSYAELQDQAGRISGRLVAAGVRPGELVPVFVSRRLAVPAILGVLMAGAAYVPLDPRYPDTRLASLVQGIGPGVMVTDEELTARAKTWFAGELVLAGATNPDCPRTIVDISPDDLAYVMFTSGSTGTPKGVLVTHRNVTRLMTITSTIFDPRADDVWTMAHSYAFDFSVWEMWGALLFGGRLIVVEDDEARASDELLRLVDREDVTVLNLTPAAFAAFLSADEQRPAGLERLRLIVLGGERLDPSTLRGWFARRGDERPRVVNMYGITETTVHVTHRWITTKDAAVSMASPIGVALPDMEISLRDEHGATVPIGSVGEICVSGPGLARGYLKDDEATARAFRTASWGPGDDRRTYLSGDLAYASADGELFYAGRRDEQVKVRGYRIELGEVIAALKVHPNVIDACVATDTGDSVGSRLLAWVTVRVANSDSHELKAFLAERLPRHMVPNELQILDRLPLTPNGKIDRRALLAPAIPTRPRSGHAGQDNFRNDSWEAAIARIWADELGMAGVAATNEFFDLAPTDDFFDLGGHSLLVINVVRRIRTELGVDLPTRALYEAPRFVEFVDTVRARTRTK